MPEPCYKGGSCGTSHGGQYQGVSAVLLGGSKENYRKAWHWVHGKDLDEFPNLNWYTWYSGPEELYPTLYGGVVGYNRAALKFGGKGRDDYDYGETWKEVFLTELYTGFNFTTLGGMLNSTQQGGAAGTANAAISFGGDTAIDFTTDTVQLFDGSAGNTGPQCSMPSWI